MIILAMETIYARILTSCRLGKHGPSRQGVHENMYVAKSEQDVTSPREVHASVKHSRRCKETTKVSGRLGMVGDNKRSLTERANSTDLCLLPFAQQG